MVTGLGVCSPLGVGVRTVWKRLVDGRSGIVHLPQSSEYEDIPSKVAGLVPRGEGEGELNEEALVSRSERKKMSLGTIYALCAAREALEDAKWLPSADLDRARTGVAVGSCLPDLEEISSAGELLRNKQYRKLSPYFVPRILTNMAAGHISMAYGFQGPNHSVSTACTTGLHALGDAASFISRGTCDVMVAGGTDACIHPIALAGFCRAKALSTKFNACPESASRPFEKRRDGFVISEGAGVLVLEEMEHARRRGAEVYAEILGYGLSGDAHHITAPPESGRGAAHSMQMALKDSNLPPTAVRHVNAHATSTPVGDAVENRAIKAVFGKHSSDLLVSAPKSSVGHLLGAAGAVEAIFTVLSVYHGIVPPTLNLTERELEFDLNYCSGGAVQWESATEGEAGRRRRRRRVALTNSFGFGGTNASLCIGEDTEC